MTCVNKFYQKVRRPQNKYSRTFFCVKKICRETTFNKELCLVYVVYVCLRMVVSNIYFVVFLLCLSSFCAPYAASFSGLSIFDCPFDIL